jgi:hypothetical protein
MCNTLRSYLIFYLDSPHGVLVKEEIIPVVAFLRQKYPLCIGMFFPTAFLKTVYCPREGTNLSVNLSTVDCTDLSVTDFIFDSIYIYK